MRILHLRVAGMLTACGRDVYRLVTARATTDKGAVTCPKCLGAVN
jgi:hypothetical protein